MTRAEILETAFSKLTEAAILLTAAGEDFLAADAEELAERVDDFIPVPVVGKTPPDRTPH